MSRVRSLRAAVLMLALALGACSSASPAPSSSPEPVLFSDCGGLEHGPAQLPDLELPCFTGGRGVQIAQLRGPLVINFWASWCAPCREELPAFQRLADSGKVPVLTVVTDTPRDHALALATDLGLSMPTLFDHDGRFRRELGESALPLTLFVTAEGGVTSYIGPPLADDTLAAQVARRLGVA